MVELKLPWLQAELPSSMRLIVGEERQSQMRVIRKVVNTRSLGNYEILFPERQLEPRLLTGGIFASDEDYWRVGTFLRKTGMTALTLTGSLDSDFPLIACEYSRALLKWIVQEYCVSPAILVEEKQGRFVQISSEKLRYTLIGLHPDDVDSFDGLFGGTSALRSSVLEDINNYEIGFGAKDRQWAKDYLFREVYPDCTD